MQAVGWPFATLALTTSLFWLGVPIGPWQLWAGLLLSLCAGRYFAGNWQPWLRAAIWLAIITLAGGAVLDWLYDFSGDGQWYHLPGALALAEGWNPLRVPRLAEWNANFAQQLPSSAIYVQHYAKGAWIVAAAAYRATGELEAAKAVNLLYLVAAYSVTAGFLGRVGLSRAWAHGLALTVACNPVTVYQMASNFVDGQLASLCTLLVILSLDYFREPRRQTLALLAACVVLLVNVKFTGFVYATFLGGCLATLFWLKGWRRRAVQYGAVGMASILLAVFVIGYQPYVTNVLHHANPFYPALGRDDTANVATAGQFDIWAPPEFIAMGRVEKLARSVFSESSGAESMPRWKAPFTLAKREFYIFFNTEPRYGGFGPLFGSVLLAVVIVFVLAGRRMDRNAWLAGSVLALMVVGSVLLNSEAWWARLSPQLWLVPLILVTAMALCASGWPRRAGAVLAMILLGNSMLVGALNLGRAVEKNLTFRDQLAHLQAIASATPLEITFHRSFRMVTERRLHDRSIRYQPTVKPSCSAPFRFSFPATAQAAACPP